jgi:fidgetin-like protein 1
MLDQLLSTEKYEVSKKDLQKFAKELDYYSASDISNLVKEAAMGPLRGFGNNTMIVISKYHVRSINIDDLVAAKKSIPPSVQKKDITFYETWEKKFTKADK